MRPLCCTNNEERENPMRTYRRRLQAWLFAPRSRDDRGDVPGWVLITVMSAGLVAALWAVAGQQFEVMLRGALDSVTR